MIAHSLICNQVLVSFKVGLFPDGKPVVDGAKDGGHLRLTLRCCHTILTTIHTEEVLSAGCVDAVYSVQ